MRKYFQMIESKRQADEYIDTGRDGEEITKHKRICEVCELQARREEFPSLSLIHI